MPKKVAELKIKLKNVFVPEKLEKLVRCDFWLGLPGTPSSPDILSK